MQVYLGGGALSVRSFSECADWGRGAGPCRLQVGGGQGDLLAPSGSSGPGSLRDGASVLLRVQSHACGLVWWWDSQALGGLLCMKHIKLFTLFCIETVNKLHQKEEQFNALSSELEKLRENLTGKETSLGTKP